MTLTIINYEINLGFLIPLGKEGDVAWAYGYGFMSGGANEQMLLGLVLRYVKERTGGLASQLDLLS